MSRSLRLCASCVAVTLLFLSCGTEPDKPEEEDPPIPFIPTIPGGGTAGSANYNPYDGGDRNSDDRDPRNYDDSGDENATGGDIADSPPPPPAPGTPPEPGDPGDPGNPGDPGDPGEGEGPDGPVETPEEFEGVWTFYNYCVIAEDRQEAMNYIDLFPNEKFFEAWLADIQVTVAAIRVRLPYPQDERPPQENCLDAYNLFKSKVVFSLAPESEQRFEIVSIDPISGLPNLRGLNLRDNKIVNIKFLRNISSLKFLDLSINLITEIPRMRRTMQIGLTNIEEIGFEYQGDQYSQVDIEGIAQLYNVQAFKLFRLKGNTIDPSSLRYFPRDFQISTTRVLKFLAGSENCDEEKWGFRYPEQLEEKRLMQCG